MIVKVGYAQGAEVDRRLEDNHIILNYQAAPDEEGFTASGALRMGVQEMTRFGMKAEDFAELARLMADCILRIEPGERRSGPAAPAVSGDAVLLQRERCQ